MRIFSVRPRAECGRCFEAERRRAQSRRSLRYPLATLALLTAICTSAPLLAQVRLGDFEFEELESGWLLESYARKNRLGTEVGVLKQSELTFRERLLLSTRGSYFDTRLLAFALNLEIGLRQSQTRFSAEDIQGEDSNGLDLAYDASMQWFREHAYGIDLYASRAEVDSRSSFSPAFRNTVTVERAKLSAREWWVPSRLIFEHRRQISRLRELNSFDSTTLRMDGEKVDRASRLGYVFDSNERTDSTKTNRFTTRRKLAQVYGDLVYGDESEHALHASASIDESKGLDQSDTSYSSAWITAEHGLSEDLRWKNQINVTRQKLGASSPTNYVEGVTGLYYKFYASFQSDIRLDASKSTFGNGTQTHQGGSAGMNYRKRTPIGILSLAYRLGIQDDDRKSSGALISVIDEVLVNDPSQLLFLENISIDASSIVVTDQTGSTTYAIPADYTLRFVGERVGIVISIGSRIAPNDTLLVDYNYAPRQALKFRETSQSASASLAYEDLASLGLYWESQRFRVRDGFFLNPLDAYDQVRIEGEFAPLRNGSIVAGYEDKDASQFPHVRRYISAALTSSLDADTTLALTSAAVRSSIGKEVRRESTWQSTLVLRRALGERTKGSLSLGYLRRWADTQNGSTVTLRSNIRSMFGESALELDFSLYDSHFEQGNDSFDMEVMVRFSRGF